MIYYLILKNNVITPRLRVIIRDAESLSFWVEFDSEFTTFLIRISEFDSEFTTLLTKISEFDSEFNETYRIQRVGARFRIPYLVVGDQIIKMATTRCNFDQNTTH